MSQSIRAGRGHMADQGEVWAQLVFSVVKNGTRKGRGVRVVVDVRSRRREVFVSRDTEIAPPVINSRPGASPALALEPALVREHGMRLQPQAAMPRTAASFSVGVRP